MLSAYEKMKNRRTPLSTPLASHGRKSNRQKLIRLCRGAMIAALYVALTYFAAALGLSSGAIQVRFSEALCILPLFMPEAVVGLWIGCMIANILTACVIWDIIFGSLATLIGALGAYFIGKWVRRADALGYKAQGIVARVLLPLPTVVSNGLIVPAVLRYAYGVEDPIYFLVITVTVGEILSAWLLGLLLLFPLEKSKSAFM